MPNPRVPPTTSRRMAMVAVLLARLALGAGGGLCAVPAGCAAEAIQNDPARDAGGIDFTRDVAPILVGRCHECHGAETKKGGLDLSTAATMQAGGESGSAIDSRNPAESLLLQRIEAGEMPPPSRGQSQRLPPAEIEILRRWLGAGSVWPEEVRLSLFDQTSHLRAGRDWWSLRPVLRPAIPAGRGKHPIDHFVLSRLAEQGLTMAPPADKRTLVRRAYFDVWGLPPTAEQIERYLADERPDAWSRLIDELLASPHYGERWARHWLDVVRFAETCGYERDQLKPGIWKYRDWVIEALNRDMPYDQFVTEQLAGDELPEPTEASVIATGMLRAGTWNDEPNDPADYVYERLEDMVDVITTAFLGMTVKCARCHDHKFDPIAQTDYYRMASFFWAGHIGQGNLGGPSPEQLGYDVFGWTDTGREAEPIRLLIKGERLQPGPVVEPGFLSAIPQLDLPLAAPPPDSKTTRRRWQLARWMASPSNPLTPRVIANRLWLHHFGQGIVRSPDNFGFKGDLPTHPDLLDWLAAELVSPAANGPSWSLKQLHKQIMLSATYQQASIHPDEDVYAQRDAGNRFLWQFPRRRLDAETLRDAMLLVSGRLQTTIGGESFYPHMSPEALEGLSRKSDAWQESLHDQRCRRSIYMMTMRSRILPLMTAFDFCDTTRPCGQRDVTVVPTQALALLNNEFVHEQSEAFAARLQAETPGGLEAIIRRAWMIALGRAPDSSELTSAAGHVRLQAAHFASSFSAPPDEAARLALASICHVLLNTNEFIYVD